MEPKAVGGQWLKERFNLVSFTLTHSSYIASYADVRVTSKGNIERHFAPYYKLHRPDDPLENLEFYLKYDDFSLDFIRTIFNHIPETEIVKYIETSPASKPGRKIGYLYEWLTGKELLLSRPVGGNYAELLDPAKYVTGEIGKNTRWRINDNLLGTPDYCPVVRRTPELKELLDQNLTQKIEKLKETFSGDIFTRATNYLYSRETRSSYEIEREQPSPDRMQKFVALLKQAGEEETEELLSESRLVHLQNAIVDPRFADTGFRDFQNYVGEAITLGHDQIHYICPPPSIVGSLMDGLKAVAAKTHMVPAEIRSGIISFGFVFIHPFEDGNGRIHRFLIHDVLTHGKIVPSGVIIPVSAHMLNNRKEYDGILEKYSRPLLQRIKFTKDDEGELAIINESEVEGYFRYPDLTDQCVYLVRAAHETAREEMPQELRFMQCYDEAKKAIQKIVDMPEKMINQMMTFLHQNKGILAKKRRDNFSKLTDQEIEQIQSVYRQVYEL